VFGTHYEFRGNSTELEWETSYSMEGKSHFRRTMPFLLPNSKLTRDRVLVFAGCAIF